MLVFSFEDGSVAKRTAITHTLSATNTFESAKGHGCSPGAIESCAKSAGRPFREEDKAAEISAVSFF